MSDLHEQTSRIHESFNKLPQLQQDLSDCHKIAYFQPAIKPSSDEDKTLPLDFEEEKTPFELSIDSAETQPAPSPPPFTSSPIPTLHTASQEDSPVAPTEIQKQEETPTEGEPEQSEADDAVEQRPL